MLTTCVRAVISTRYSPIPLISVVVRRSTYLNNKGCCFLISFRICNCPVINRINVTRTKKKTLPLTWISLKVSKPFLAHKKLATNTRNIVGDNPILAGGRVIIWRGGWFVRNAMRYNEKKNLEKKKPQQYMRGRSRGLTIRLVACPVITWHYFEQVIIIMH